MKAFLERYSYYSVKMFIDQIAISMFGLVLALVSAKAGNQALKIITGVGSVVFYLFLLYTIGWEIGSKDKVSVELGKMPKRPLTGVAVSLLANSINLLFAVCFFLGAAFPESGVCLGFGRVGMTASLLLQGMYTGLLSLQVGEIPLNTLWYMYFLITVPAMLVSGVSYLMGLHDVMLTGIMRTPYPESDRPQKKRKGQ